MTAQTELLLQVWETQAGAHPIRRALALLAALWPQRSEREWALASIGERDACLLALHEALFGGRLQATARCPRCDERLETEFEARDIRVDAAAIPAALELERDGYAVSYRLPNSDDLLAVGADADADADAAAPAQQLLRRCLLQVRRADAAPMHGPDALPPPLRAAIAEGMRTADPGADIQIGLSCPACTQAFSVGFDVVAYLWGEIDDWAQALLADVHQLASAYGWSERDILGLNPVRRQFYLDLVRA